MSAVGTQELNLDEKYPYSVDAVHVIGARTRLEFLIRPRARHIRGRNRRFHRGCLPSVNGRRFVGDASGIGQTRRNDIGVVDVSLMPEGACLSDKLSLRGGAGSLHVATASRWRSASLNATLAYPVSSTRRNLRDTWFLTGRFASHERHLPANMVSYLWRRPAAETAV